MKRSLAILVVIAFVAALSSAAVFTPVKDAFLRYDGGDATPFVDPAYYGQGVYTYGGQPYNRAGKPWNQDRFIIDFDRAAILADASAQLGHAATAADFTSGAVAMTLYLKAAPSGISTWNSAAMYFPAYFTSTTAWSGESSASFAYADGTDGNNPIDLPNTTAWNGLVNDSALGMLARSGNAAGGANGTVRDCPWYWEAGSAQPWTTTEVYTPFVFPGAIAAGYLFSPLNAYIAMSNADVDNNGFCYSKESTGNGPLLNIALVPEPMTLRLVAVGTLALIRRRR